MEHAGNSKRSTRESKTKHLSNDYEWQTINMVDQGESPDLKEVVP